VPDKHGEIGRGSIDQIQAARAAGVKVYVYDAARAGLTKRYRILALAEPTRRRAARVAFPAATK
jgi:hypothetical protein